jgi:hypothetical protein
MWCTLGLSLAPLIKVDSCVTLIRSLAQLMEEFDHYVENRCRLTESMKMGMRSYTAGLDSENEAIKPKLHKIGTHIAFEFLIAVNMVLISSSVHMTILPIAYQFRLLSYYYRLV